MSTQPFSHNFVKPDWRRLFAFGLYLLAFVYPCQVVLSAQDLSDKSIQFEVLPAEDQEIHIAYSGDQDKIGVLFIHGTPGDWSAFERYLVNPELQNEFFMVSMDRPEWGSSTLLANQNPNLFATQVSAIELILSQYPTKHWVIVGHSLGASIAPKLALKSGNSIKGLLLLAGSLDPALGKPRWYNHVANNMLLKWFVPRKLRASNKEIMQLRDELSLMESELENTSLNTRVTVIQGMRDRLVSPNNTRYMRKIGKILFEMFRLLNWKTPGIFAVAARKFDY